MLCTLYMHCIYRLKILIWNALYIDETRCFRDSMLWFFSSFRFRITRCHFDKNTAFLSIKYFWNVIEKIKTECNVCVYSIRSVWRFFSIKKLWFAQHRMLYIGNSRSVCVLGSRLPFLFHSDAFSKRQWTLQDSLLALFVLESWTIFHDKCTHFVDQTFSFKNTEAKRMLVFSATLLRIVRPRLRLNQSKIKLNIFHPHCFLFSSFKKHKWFR